MIVKITEDTTRIGVRLYSVTHDRIAADWRRLVMTVLKGEDGDQHCGVGGSPWILHGCWWGLPTEVDVANPHRRRAVPATQFPSCAMGDDCEVVFDVGDRMKDRPFGRYTAFVRALPPPPGPCDESDEETAAAKTFTPKPVPRSFIYGAAEHCNPPLPPFPHPEGCVLGRFDIDFGPRCESFVVDHVTVMDRAMVRDEDSV